MFQFLPFLEWTDLLFLPGYKLLCGFAICSCSSQNGIWICCLLHQLLVECPTLRGCIVPTYRHNRGDLEVFGLAEGVVPVCAECVGDPSAVQRVRKNIPRTCSLAVLSLGLTNTWIIAGRLGVN